MKNLTLTCFIIACSLIACNNNKAKKTDQTASDKSSTEAVPGNENDIIQQKMEEMKKLTPLNPDQLKAKFPEQLNGMKRTDYKPVNSEGYEVGEASYASDDGKELDVTIIDCAGEAGAGKYNIMFVGYLNTESADDNGYKKSIRFNGDKAIESYDKNQERYSMLFLSGDRLLINVEGEKTGLDAVKQVSSNLSLKAN